ncbi:hypothetical protein [uncultured Friedmanniella sp.]|uniref:hypothetical protein n=1 Tax=uncultured Friedmanniella sp. TaxID=335381 RepID=UPI0035CAFD9E
MNGFFLATETDTFGKLADWESFGAVQNSNERRAATSRSSALVRWHNAGKHAGTANSDCSLCSGAGDAQ